MDKRELLIFFHILGALLIVAGAGAATALGVVASRSSQTRTIAATSHAAVLVSRLVISPGALILVAFGTWLVAEYALYDFDEGWISGAYVIWIVSVAVGTGYLTPYSRRIRDKARALIADGVEESEELRVEADAPLPKITGTLLNVLLIVALYLMVVRPGD